MAPRCVRYNCKKRSNQPVIKAKRGYFQGDGQQHPERLSTTLNATLTAGEGWFDDNMDSPQPILSPCERLRSWLKKQRFIPQDLSDDFLAFFLTACNYNMDLAEEKLQKYFTSRQEPSLLFRDRDPLSPENYKISKELYVLPIPETTADGKKIILTGAVKPLLSYNQIDHAKLLAMVFDLLIWEKDFGFGDYVIVFDGRGFNCPQLLENKVRNHRSIGSLLQDTIPGRLRSFYFLYPPAYVENVAATRHGLWVTIVKTKREMTTHLSADSLPLEYGGNLGHLGDLLEQWDQHMIQNREFFVEFEKRMITYYERRVCYEEEIKKWGKSWVQHMKLVDDEWEYKKKYYQRMKCMVPIKHPAYGSQRVLNMTNKNGSSLELKGPCGRLKKVDEAFKGPPDMGFLEEAQQNQVDDAKEESPHCIVLPILELKTFYDTDVSMAADDILADVKAQSAAQAEAEAKAREEMEAEIRAKNEAMAKSEAMAQKDPSVLSKTGVQVAPEVPLEEEEEEKSESEPEIDFEKELVEFNHWLAREPYLPKNIDEEILITFLWDAQSLEQAEAKLMNYYYMRQSFYAVFRDRHPCSPNNLLKYDAVCVIPLTCGTDKKWIIFATWLSHNDPSKFSIYHMTKLIFTELDILLQENQIRGKRVSVIIDMKEYTPVHTEMITKFAAKRICHLFTDSFPATFNGFYIVNAPEHVSDYTSLFQPLDFHIVESLNDLPGFLPKKYLPSDMGGEPDAPNRASMFEPFFKRMQRCGNWLAYEELVRSQEMMLRMTTKREDFVYGPVK